MTIPLVSTATARKKSRCIAIVRQDTSKRPYVIEGVNLKALVCDTR